MKAPDPVEMQADGSDLAPATVPVIEEPRAQRARYRLPLLIAAPVILIIGALFFYLNGGRYEATDNAYIQSTKVQISANVSGRVIAVEVASNTRVRAGQILFRLDPAPFHARVAEAAAKLAAARLQIDALRANYRQGSSELKATRDRLHFAERERDRQKQLLADGISSQAQYDNAALAAVTASQQIQTVIQQNGSVLANLGGNANGRLDDNAVVRQAQAELDQAELDLSYTVVRAPQDGTVAKVDQLPVGNYVTAAKPLFILVSNALWVEGNFKENQLHYMRLGQPVTVRIDAFPDLHLTGRIASFSPGTGNTFSLLPPENATGNWVKVTQRLPVEFSLDRIPAGVPLHAGLSATVTVDTGHRRHLFGEDSATPGSPR